MSNPRSEGRALIDGAPIRSSSLRALSGKARSDVVRLRFFFVCSSVSVGCAQYALPEIYSLSAVREKSSVHGVASPQGVS